MGIVVAVLGISLLVIIHETGHYVAARAFGMRVLRYSIGFGPVLCKVRPKGSPTTFQICAIPFLAYVQIDGMNPTGEVDRSDPALFPNKSLLARIVTIAAGPFANYAAASILCFGVFAIDGVPVPREDVPMIVGEVVSGSPAAAAGIRPGDRIVEAQGRPISNIQDLVAVTRPRAGQPTSYVIERNGVRLDPMTITPRNEGGRGIIGVAPLSRYERVSLGEAARLALLAPVAFSVRTVAAIFEQIRNRTMDGLAGPVRMVEEASDRAEHGPRSYIEFIAVLSIALGFFNLLPFPALDGGRLVFLLFELVTRRRANERVEAMIHTVGILVLLGLIALVTYRDISRWIGRWIAS